MPPSAFVVSRNDWIVGKKTIILEGYKMEKYIYNEKTDFGMNCKMITIFLT